MISAHRTQKLSQSKGNVDSKTSFGRLKTNLIKLFREFIIVIIVQNFQPFYRHVFGNKVGKVKLIVQSDTNIHQTGLYLTYIVHFA